MSDNQRATQFQCFAKLLFTEMLGNYGYIDVNEWDTEEVEQYEAMIAQRAYDLSVHVISTLYTRMYNIMGSERMKEFTVESCLSEIADMTELSKDKE